MRAACRLSCGAACGGAIVGRARCGASRRLAVSPSRRIALRLTRNRRSTA
ncbi:hypothetical protein BURMUCF2_A2201 [Burkholderia multivorans CF2]|nr:hypothetical protein BURMUCF2_A2201 [Burkholderia multivorans CF2]